MISDSISKVTCPKCGSVDDVFKFENDIYIVRDNNDFVRRKMYGCEGCKNVFTYDSTPRKESKDMNITNIRNAFSKIAKQCEKATSNVTLKM
jgi:transposase-like protein